LTLSRAGAHRFLEIRCSVCEGHFRDFMFTNGEANPDFFTGTVVERQAREVLGTLSRAAS